MGPNCRPPVGRISRCVNTPALVSGTTMSSPRQMRNLLLSAGLSVALSAGTLHGQVSRPADLEAQLPSRAGVDRARVLARLVDAYKLDKPAQAVAYGVAALEQLARTPDSATQVVTLSELGWAYMQLSRFDEAMASADSARRLAARTGQRRGEARAISNLGTIAQRRGEPERAIEQFKQALAIQRSLGDNREIANSLNNMGFVHSTDLADYPSALSEHLEALTLREAMHDSTQIALSLNNIGIVYGRLRQYAIATDYFERALAMRRVSGNQVRIAGTLSNLGDMYLERGDPARALARFREALAIRLGASDPAAISTSHRNIASSLLAMDKLADAGTAMRRSESAGVGLEDRGLLVGNLLARSAIDRAQGNAAAAESRASHALDIARAMHSRELVRRSLEGLSAAQEAAQSHLSALRTLQRANAVSDSILDNETGRRIAALQGRFNEERRARELASLRRDEAQAELRATRQASERNAVIVVAVVMGLFGLALYRRRVDLAEIAERLSTMDPLTGAKNRRFVEQTITADVAVSARRHIRASQRGVHAEDADIVFLLLDIDRFKAINDQHGHAAGDHVLREIVGVLNGTCRQSDVVIRWGGEEFLVIGRFTDRALAAIHAERMRHAVESHVVRIRGHAPISVTCCVGYAAFPFRQADPESKGWMDVVALADHAAYVAKHNGRNRSAGLLAGPHAAKLTTDPITSDSITVWLAEGVLDLEDDTARRVGEPIP